MPMKVTFVIPALNEEANIGQVVASVLGQSETAAEIIVVDNGSTDETAKIAKNLGVKVIEEKEKGISSARNRGAKEALGDVICFVDADGVLPKNWLMNAERTLSNPKVDCVSGLIFYSHPNFLKFLWYNSYLLFAYLALFFNYFVLGKSFVFGNNTAIKKEVFFALGGFEKIVGEDYWFTKKFNKEGYQGRISLQMPIFYSSRGFDYAGYFKTLFYWVKATQQKLSQKGYSYQHKG